MNISPCALLLLFLVGCADPRPPTGGPPDRIPPVLETTVPQAEAVNVTETTIRLTFSEYVDQASFARAFAVTPAPEGQVRFKWRKRRVDIRFPEALRDSTTYVLTIDTNLRDAHGVAVRTPITFAFSTGPVINKGRLTGRVFDVLDGTGIAGFDVLAYAAPDSTAPDSLPDHPDYRTQTDENGQFEFSFLREQPYFVAALQDRNRNRRPDANEAFAAPPHPVLHADSMQTADSLRWFITIADTIAPLIQRVRPLSNRRLALRFSEAIQLPALTPGAWHVEDSSAAQPRPVQAVYLFSNDPRQVYLLTDSLAPTTHWLRTVSGAVTDSSNNPLAADTVRFTVAASRDTMQFRFLDFVPEAASPAGSAQVLAPTSAPGIRFNEPVSPARLAALLTPRDTTGQPLAFEAVTHDGTTYRLAFTPPLQPGQSVELQVDGQQAGGIDTVYTRTFQRIAARDLGSLSGITANADTSGTLIVELYAVDDPAAPQPYATTQPDTTGAFSFEDLPEGPYRFRIFVDRNGNERWDGGQLLPYRPAEPILWNTEPASVRARWDSALKDTLRIAAPS